ncbi:type 2 lanthipeptide synthetase LanM [Caulobacter segnis]|uniref:type 2 lanthipeptide synthetase LanM n=1 Tax=Caulobacter segnis TaxID=88688 RepID=UPI0024104F7F|nr:type 2 lanthipeptide synthetase LanM [Caulobacter segnis]MDG2520819.1 type 2 lanthipeptide synthetase LanM [Caulobacter segnis]
MDGLLESEPSDTGWRAAKSEIDLHAEVGDTPILSSVSGVRELIAPYVLWIQRRFNEAFSNTLNISEAAKYDIAAYASARLARIAAPSVAISLNIARQRSELTGETAEDRARHFADRLGRADGRREFLASFPVLERSFLQIASDISDAVEEFAGRVICDAFDLEVTFGVNAKSIDRIEMGLGDPHRGARNVCCVQFGGDKLIYKPRGLSSDEFFYEILEAATSESERAAARPKMISRSDHGWVEYIKGTPCVSENEVKQCYERIGALLCVLYVSGASDVHYENIICRGAHPFIVDLETVLSPWPAMAKSAPLTANSITTIESVLRTGYLPQRFRFGDTFIDVSGAGLSQELEGPLVDVLTDLGRDDVRTIKTRGKLVPLNNLPSLGNVRQTPDRFVQEMCRGFERAYLALLNKKRDLIALGRKYSEMEFRWVARATSAYGTILRNSHHPRFMRDACERDMAFSPLGEADGRPRGVHRDLVRSELEDLWRGDIPIFVARANSKDVEGADGRTIRGVFSRSGIRAFTERVRRLGLEDLDNQTRLVRLSMAAAAGASHGNGGRRAHASALTPIEAAIQIGDQLIADQIVTSGHAVWPVIERLVPDGFALKLADWNLYEGSPGIGLFFAELFRVTGEARFKLVAERCLSGTREKVRRGLRGPIGAYTGSAGLAYSEMRISSLLGADEPEITNRILSHIARWAHHDQNLDVISGAAGAAIFCVNVSAIGKFEQLGLAAAVACAERLRATAVRDDGLASWFTVPDQPALSGFSHGASGIALALAKVGSTVGDQELVDLAWAALRFEETQFSTAQRNWADRRTNSAGEFSVAWCHGAPGIALARNSIQRLGLKGEPDFLSRSIDAAATTTRAVSTLGSDCLCHGSFGNLTCLTVGQHVDAAFVEKAVDQLLHRAAKDGRWRCDPVEDTPSLMTGLAGIGYSLLRYHDPAVPNVLLMDLAT